MSTLHLVPADIRTLYHVKEWRNAAGVLTTACPDEWRDLLEVLRSFRLLRSEVVVGGGNRSPVSRRIDGAFYARGWAEKDFATAFIVDGTRIESPTHAVDCFRAGVALEVEWNNKDPFFDRDLNNFRLLFELRAIQVGVIITRATELHAIFKREGKGSSYGQATTHHEKLWPKVEGGGGGGCPVLTFAITPALYVDDGDAAVAKALAAQAEARSRMRRRGLGQDDVDDL
ncbi:MAG: BglII/BstYI family type II restriction endonuclease [Bryobacteraceae bacterium]